MRGTFERKEEYYLEYEVGEEGKEVEREGYQLVLSVLGNSKQNSRADS